MSEMNENPSTTEEEVQNVEREIRIVEEGAPKAKSPLETFVDHQKKAFEESSKALDALLPDAFKEHSKEARKEFAKGVKVLVDAAVGELEKATRELDKQFRAHQQGNASAKESEPKDRPSTTGANKVKVQVD